MNGDLYFEGEYDRGTELGKEGAFDPHTKQQKPVKQQSILGFMKRLK